MNQRFLLAAAAIAVVGVGFKLSAQEFARRSEVGRYRLGTAGAFTFVIDTATAQVWQRTDNGTWIDGGNPARSKDQEGSPKKATTLDLKGRPTDMVIVQREQRAVPGSDGTVLIRVGDITDAQAFLTITGADGEELLPRTSVKQGDLVPFSVGAKRYTVRVVELRNILIGDDFARLTIAEETKSAKADVASDFGDK